jgi:enoyl-[acyl-carrier-protein] reductase (NADH)
VDEDHQNDVGVVERVLIGHVAKPIMTKPVGDRRRQRQHVGKDQRIDRMGAEIGERCQQLDGMVHFVEFPQERHLVAELVAEPVAELIGEEQHHRDGGA